jgi:hypothetical protein
MTTPGGQAAIDAATKRNGRVFAAYIVLLLVSALLIAYFTWLTWDSGNKLQDAIQGDATARIAEAQKDNLTLQGQVAILQTDAATQQERAAKAEASIALAEQHAAEANAKAEGFRLDIAKANDSAAQAQAQVAGATAEAAKANLELEKLKTPRTFALPPDTLSAFQQFPGTEYTFSTVATDQESIDLLKQIDTALQGAGWKRVKPDPPATMGANVFGDEDRIAIGILKGVKVEVGCAMDAEALQQLPSATWPMPVKLAGAVRNAIASFTTPSSDGNVAPSVVILKGSSEVIRISVGSKP